MRYTRLMPFVIASLSASVWADTPRDFQSRFEKDAGAAGNSTRGARFFSERHGGEWSCSSCHTDNPSATGRHAKTDKAIKPMAPVANADRFTDPAKVEKWFRRNCNDVVGRECSAGEKADVMAFLTTHK